MDYLRLGLALGVDLLCLGVCAREYFNCRRNINLLKAAPELAISPALKEYAKQAMQETSKLPYVTIRGMVTPIDTPIRSHFTPSTASVLQINKFIEHRAFRTFAGFWSDRSHLLTSAIKTIPFELRCKNFGVEISDATVANILDLDMIYDKYEPTDLSLFHHLCCFFTGVRHSGYQMTEEILREGSFATAIGQLELHNDKLRLQSTSRFPMFLTTLNKSTLLKKFEDAKNSTLFRMFIYGAISVILIGIMMRKLYSERKESLDKRKLLLEWQRQLRERGERPRVPNPPPEQSCVVCHTNPKEVIFLPCGHVCSCEDCSRRIETDCPVCRTSIELRAPAYIS